MIALLRQTTVKRTIPVRSSEEISVTFTSVILPMRQQNKIYSRTNILSKRVCLLVFPSLLSASVVSVRLLLCADDYEVSLPCLLLRLAGIFPVLTLPNAKSTLPH